LILFTLVVGTSEKLTHDGCYHVAMIFSLKSL
jgi:hypothetical protein